MPDELSAVLTQLRDIHEPNWFSWPFPWGWWMLLICLLLAIGCLSYAWWRVRKLDLPYRTVRHAAMELQQNLRQDKVSEGEYVEKLNKLLKHLLVRIEEANSAVSADGHQWLSMLNERFEDDRFLRSAGKPLGAIRYTKNVFFDASLVDLIDETLCQVKPLKKRDAQT